MAEFIKESDLNYALILKQVGAYTQGDEDFDVFKCPSCNRIYLIEYEAGTIFSDPEDLSVLQSSNALLSCLSCNYSFPEGEPIIGPKSNDKYRVTKSQLLESKWSWLLRQSQVFVLDGNACSSLDEFTKHFSDVVLSGHYQWNGNMDAFNDILRGGFGTPENGFVIRWKNSEIARAKLGYAETIRQLERRLEQCHPSNKEHFISRLEAARRNAGPTVFDELVEILRDHGPAGKESEDEIELILE